MNPELMSQFLTHYAAAKTPRKKALAVYNAVVTAVPRDQLAAFLGDGGDAFLSYIRTLQNEDSDVGTALASPDAAPPEAYLASLIDKLSALR